MPGRRSSVPGTVIFSGASGALPPRSNNNEAMDGVALFSAGLTLETYVTGAPNPVKCSASYGRGLLDGKRNPPKRRQVFDRRRSGPDHARVEDDRVSAGPLRRAGSNPRRTLLPGTGSSGQPVSESRLRRYRLNRPAGRADRSGPPRGSGWHAGARRKRLSCGPAGRGTFLLAVLLPGRMTGTGRA